jgi:putative endonuclease
LSRQKGNIAEDTACAFLIQNGYEIVCRNFYSRYGEVDIIANKDGVVRFVEVKSGQKFEPLFNVTPQKLEKILKSVDVYLAQNSANLAFAIDVVVVKNGICEIVENVTL